jgi:hypothetical protein
LQLEKNVLKNVNPISLQTGFFIQNESEGSCGSAHFLGNQFHDPGFRDAGTQFVTKVNRFNGGRNTMIKHDQSGWFSRGQWIFKGSQG